LAHGGTQMTPHEELSPRLRRMLEIIYAVDGVAAARVWQWPGEDLRKVIAVAIRPAPRTGPQELLQRVEAAVAGLREPDEEWEFGLLEE
jgi:hypothetical protein